MDQKTFPRASVEVTTKDGRPEDEILVDQVPGTPRTYSTISALGSLGNWPYRQSRVSSLNIGAVEDGPLHDTKQEDIGAVEEAPLHAFKQEDIGAVEDAPLHASEQLDFDVMDEPFPPSDIGGIAEALWNPDDQVRRTHRAGLRGLEKKATTIWVGIIFLEYQDKASIEKCEMDRLSRAPDQKTPHWRVNTANTLLERFDVGSSLSVDPTGVSHDVPKRGKAKMEGLNSLASPDRNRQIPHFLVQTIDSLHVILIQQIDPSLDINCTLVEIDMLSMRDLLRHHRTIIASFGELNPRKSKTPEALIQVLEVMINDVRALYTQNPRLFRMAIRPVIAKSTDIRYGVEYPTMFVTLTTSEGIRKIVETSAACFLSLHPSNTDRELIRPKFLQMLVLLLSLLNNEDLRKLKLFLERTLQIPGDRANLELLIMKVLPLESIDPEAFLKDLCQAYQPLQNRVTSLKSQRSPQSLWRDFQLEIGENGFICPLPASAYYDTAMNIEVQGARNPSLEAQDSAKTEPRGSQESNSWLSSWPPKWTDTSTMLRYLQHDGGSRENGSSIVESMRVLNDIPKFEIGAEEEVLVQFDDRVQYRMSAADAHKIRYMEKGLYVLRAVDSDSVSILEIDNEILNERLRSAFSTLHWLCRSMRSLDPASLEKVLKRRSLFSNKKASQFYVPPSVLPKGRLPPEPALALKVQAHLSSPTEDRHCSAVVFKSGAKHSTQNLVLSEMKQLISLFDSAVEGLGQYNKIYGQSKTYFDSDFKEFRELIEDVRTQAQRVEKMRTTYPTNPIKKVTYRTPTENMGDQQTWQDYSTRPSSDGDCMIIKSKRLTVEAVSPIDDNSRIVELSFALSTLVLSVEPLAPLTSSHASQSVSSGTTVLWLGYYLMVVEASEPPAYFALAYYRILSQKQGPDEVGKTNGVQHIRNELSVLK